MRFSHITRLATMATLTLCLGICPAADERSWTNDTPEQFAEILSYNSPDPLSVLSISEAPL